MTGTKTGILISNLGSPDAPDKKSLKKHLKQFLSDERVIQPIIPRWMWWLILNGIILNTRPKKSAKLYKSIWGKFGVGAPLVDIANKQLKALQLRLKNENIFIEMGMRYGNPSIQEAVSKLRSQDIDKLIVLPLYPQYSQTTTESTFDIIHALSQQDKKFSKFKLVHDYHQNPLYIKALKHSIEQHQKLYGKPQKLIISFHGIPQVYCDNGDVYPQQCFATAELLVAELGLSTDDYMLCFQSRFGKLEWLKPYLDVTLEQLPSQGIKNVQIICPGFSADCLETLEEIEHENQVYFIQAGGEKYSYIPALNANVWHIDCLESIIQQAIK